jgi:hypothetical protein
MYNLYTFQKKQKELEEEKFKNNKEEKVKVDRKSNYYLIYF